MPKVERNVRRVLSDENHLASERVSNACLVKHVWITPRAVANHDTRTVDERHHILNDRRVLPNIVSATTAQARIGSSLLDRHVNVVERCVERHHRRSEEHTSELQSLMRISYAVFCL